MQGDQYLLNILSHLLEAISKVRIKIVTEEINYIRKSLFQNIEIFPNYSAGALWAHHSPLPDPGELPIRPEHIYQNVYII